MKSRDIRKLFTEFFEERRHVALSSSSLIPPDPTVLLTTAGMQQMTPFFLGLEKPPHNRLTSIQKSFRTDDIEEIGDESHCTFFEMLGNFSVGDYFKREAIQLAWELSTGPFQLPPERIWVTVHPEDDVARAIWRDEIGIPPERIQDDPEDFWGPVGETGPCGPNSELYYDRYYEPDGDTQGGPMGDSGERYVEFWNLVFMEFNRLKDGTLVPLPSQNVDTGMGLERISLVLQGADSIYDTDLYQPIITQAAEIASVEYQSDEKIDRSLRVIADHTRAVTFLIADGVLPGNEGRSYVLRRVLRRAVRHGRTLGIDRPFLAELTDVVIENFSDQFPELLNRREHIHRVVNAEQEAFSRTLATGMTRFETLVADFKSRGETVVPGDEAFRLHDTYGFPIDITVELAGDAGLEVDREGFERALEVQREQSRSQLQSFADASRQRAPLYAAAKGRPVQFEGYASERDSSTIADILDVDSAIDQAEAGMAVEVVLDRTVFYGESGGQVGDTGSLITDTGVFRVDDTQRPIADLIVHRGEVVEGFIAVGQTVQAEITHDRRSDLRRNHTATHLLHRALRIVLGEEAHQAGSLVAPDRLRFDFTSTEALGIEGIQRITALANAQVLADKPVQSDVMTYDQAIERGAMALFGEKYGDEVRVIDIPEFSTELCGGTHVSHTGEIGPVVILSESSIGSGIRRIEAITGHASLDYLSKLQGQSNELARMLRVPAENVVYEVQSLTQQLRESERTIDQLRLRLATGDIDNLLNQAVQMDGTSVLTARIDVADRDTLREVGDRLRDRLGSGVVVLGSTIEDQPALLAMVTKDQTSQGLHAGKLIQEIAPIVGGRGGGRPELAQGGGTDSSRLDEALAAVASAVQRQIAG
ncbi:alanine--tRNA ligase [soil metagenome]